MPRIITKHYASHQVMIFTETVSVVSGCHLGTLHLLEFLEHLLMLKDLGGGTVNHHYREYTGIVDAMFFAGYY
jgi:hypothetical protein